MCVRGEGGGALEERQGKRGVEGLIVCVCVCACVCVCVCVCVSKR